MPTGATNKPLAMFETLCNEQGRLKTWVAEQAGLDVHTLSKRFRNRKWYGWKPGEREAVAKALGVPLSVIWPDADAAVPEPATAAGE